MTGRGLRLALGLLVMAPALSAAPSSHVCIEPDGRKTIQQTPCKLPPATTVVEPRPCPMTDAEFGRAARQETAFLSRHATAAAHRSAQRAELVPVVARLGPMQERLALLLKDRRDIDKELEFHVGRPLPPALAARHDANQAQLAGLAQAFQRPEETIRDIEARGRCQVETFGPRWSGAATGVSACRRPACVAP